MGLPVPGTVPAIGIHGVIRLPVNSKRVIAPDLGGIGQLHIRADADDREDAQETRGIAGIGEGDEFVAVDRAVAVEVEGGGVLRDGGADGQGFPDVGVVVGQGAGFIRADVGDADDGEAALVAGDGAADGSVARGAVEDEGARPHGAAVVVERGEERVGAADGAAAGGGDAA